MLTAAATVADAASVTKQVYVTFDGSLAGTAYTLGAGEIDNSFTFRGERRSDDHRWHRRCSGRYVDLTSGFFFSGADLVTEEGLGSLKTTNWITRSGLLAGCACRGPAQPGRQHEQLRQPHPGSAGRYVLSLRRFRLGRPKVTDVGYWDGGSEDIESVG